jgi:DNA-binding NtrC family response regulator
LTLGIEKNISRRHLKKTKELMTQSPAKILVIENDINVGLGLDMLLAFDGFAPTICSTLQDVKNYLLEKQTPNLVLIDYWFGSECVQSIISLLNYKDIPIVIMSADLDVGAKVRELRVSDFILKPFIPDQLIKTLLHHLRVSPHKVHLNNFEHSARTAAYS